MSIELTTTKDEAVLETETISSDIFTQSSTWFASNPEEEWTSTAVSTRIEEIPVTTEGANDLDGITFESQNTLFEAFLIVEIVMTALEFIVSVLAAYKVSRWRRNFRNQMLMQFSLVRFLKRVYSLIEFLERNKKIKENVIVTTLLEGIQFYIDFVIVILVCFFIKHMYDSLIVVVCKINRHQLLNVTLCSWLIPLPVSVTGAILVYTEVVPHKIAYVFICAAFKWPLMLIGTIVYLTILFKVLCDKIRRFARSLTIITFLLCLVLNFHLFCKDMIWLNCIESFSTNIASYALGFVTNVLVLCLYIVLITLHLKCKKSKSCDSAFYSEAFTKC